MKGKYTYMEIIQNLVAPSKYGVKCPHEMNATRIVVHNTANNASAIDEINYMINNDNQVSFHFAVDDIHVVQGIPINRNAWHAGDGADGVGNREGIAIEICYSKDERDLNKFLAAEEKAAEMISELLKERNWDISKVTKHQDYSGKYCPHKTLDLGWNRFLDLVREKMICEGEIKMVKQNMTTLTLTKATINGNQYRTRTSIMGNLADASNYATVGGVYPLLEVTENVQSDGYKWGKIVVNDTIVFIQMDMDYMFTTAAVSDMEFEAVGQLYRKVN